MSNKIEDSKIIVGEYYKTKYNGEVLVVNYHNYRDVDVKFKDTGFETKVRVCQLESGKIKDPLRPTVKGVGFIGIGAHRSSVDGRVNKVYRLWLGMLERCYCDKLQVSNPSYIGCSVSEEWHNFQRFAEWCTGRYRGGYQLDKDLLKIGNKIYSKDTCVFVPKSLNIFTINSSNKRGRYKIGVSSMGDRFVSNCSDGTGGLKYLGTYEDEDSAHNAWKTYKLGLADKMKVEMDRIDIRIYPNVIIMINSNK